MMTPFAGACLGAATVAVIELSIVVGWILRGRAPRSFGSAQYPALRAPAPPQVVKEHHTSRYTTSQAPTVRLEPDFEALEPLPTCALCAQPLRSRP